MEPGETFEDSIKRELWEEAGVKVWDIKYHSSQPWVSEYCTSPGWVTDFPYRSLCLCAQPFPANLMVGFYATASESQQIRTDLDNELAGKWNRLSYFCRVHFLNPPFSQMRDGLPATKSLKCSVTLRGQT